MSWNIFEIFETAADVFSAAATSPIKDSEARARKKSKKKDKYFTEKVSARFILASAVLFFIAFHKPFPIGDQTQAVMVASLIGIALSAVMFFVLHLMEFFYFKNIFKLLLFSGSVISFFISLVLCIYFKSGIFF